MERNRVFLDSSILITALLSSRGGSFYILTQLKDKYRFLINEYVFNETLTTLNRKFPHRKELKNYLFLLMGLSKIEILPKPSKFSLKRVSKIINKKDAPILISALQTSHYLITLDKKDFLNPKVLEFTKKKKLSILTPKEFIEKELPKI